MRVFVVHDMQGNIRSFAVPAHERRDEISLEPAKGQHVSEVEVSGFERLEPEDRTQLQRLHETLKRHRVKRGRGEAALVPRSRGRK
jgi:hypothetical protein